MKATPRKEIVAATGEFVGQGIGWIEVCGRGTYNQGVMQTIQRSSGGVDPRTGRTLNGTTAGMITGNAAADIERKIKLYGASNRGEPLMPVYDAQGVVLAYERSIVPSALARMNANTNLGEMLGAWAGRHEEERLAFGFNQELVRRQKELWDKAKRDNRTKEFVDLSDATLKDPVYRDTWKMVPPEMRAEIRKVFGPDGFPVRRDMIENTLGFREASIGDLWTGMTRLDPKIQKAFSSTATLLMGKNAYRYLVTAQEGLKAGVSVAKNTIIIRSVIVPGDDWNGVDVPGARTKRLVTSGLKRPVPTLDACDSSPPDATTRRHEHGILLLSA